MSGLSACFMLFLDLCPLKAAWILVAACSNSSSSAIPFTTSLVGPIDVLFLLFWIEDVGRLREDEDFFVDAGLAESVLASIVSANKNFCLVFSLFLLRFFNKKT